MRRTYPPAPGRWSNRTSVLSGVLLLTLILFTARATVAQQTQDTHAVYLPVITKSRLAPNATTSYYITKTTTERVAQLLGCAASVEMQQKMIPKGFIVLFFGKPAHYQDLPENPIQQGTILIDDDNFTDMSWIEARVQAWIKGFVNGYHYPDSQYDCGLNNNVYPNNLHATFAVGITNEPVEFITANNTGHNTHPMSDSFMEEHGKSWADFINRSRDYVKTNDWEDRVAVVTGYDAEVLYNSAEETRKWLVGYTKNTSYRYYYLGACEGCPYPQVWSIEDVWDVTTGFGATLIPQIYTTNGQTAEQWGVTAAILRQTPDLNSDIPGVYLKPLTFNGVLTQHQACDDRGRDSKPPVSGSEYCEHGAIYNTPEQAWMQAYEVFEKYGFLRYLPWSTDIAWNQDFSQFLKR